MSDQQLHHLFNHLPSIGLIIGVMVMIVSLLFKKSQALSAGAIILLISGLSVLPVNKTGEDTEERIEQIAGVNESAIKDHEEAAEQVLPFAIASAVLALFYLVAAWKGWKWSNTIAIAALLVAGMAIYFVIEASHRGGLIRHPELDSAAIAPLVGGGEENEEDD
ncbi:MAG: hypothetical protein SGI87_10790 [Flavobacteriales bacterium]|nr:hypothetical protein [Flavobacteriales bacterium]